MHVPPHGSKKVAVFAVAGVAVLIGISVIAVIATRSTKSRPRPAAATDVAVPEPVPGPMPEPPPTFTPPTPPAPTEATPPVAATTPAPPTHALPPEIARPAVIQAGSIRPAEAAGLVFPVQRPRVESTKGLVESDVRYASEHLLPMAQKCFELREDKRMGGRATLAFTIVVEKGQATVRDGELADSTIADSSVNDCLRNGIATASFPMPAGEGEMVVTYPIDFPGSSGGGS